MWILLEGDAPLATITTSTQLVEWLHQFRQQFGSQHRILTLQSDAASLHIGIGQDMGFLNYLSRDWRQPSYAAVGSPAFGPLDAPVVFHFPAHRTEVARRYCLPFATLIAVLVEYMETGQLATAIPWEAV